MNYKKEKWQYRRNNIINYFLMYLVFAFGGTPFFSIPKFMKVIFVITAGLIFFYKKKEFKSGYAKVLIWITIIFIAQLIKFQGGTFINYGLIIIIITIPYFVLEIVGYKFTTYYVNITYFFAIIGLIFYTLSIFYPAFYSYTETIAPRFGTDPTIVVEENFIIYAFERKLTNYLRSPGPFWEPGAYATFLIIALVFNIIENKKLFNIKNIVFVIAIVTTFSSAGYLSLFLLLIVYLLFAEKKYSKKIIYLPIILIGFAYLFLKLDFLSDKLTTRYEAEAYSSLNTPTAGRILGARKSLLTISRHPLFGRGLVTTTRPDIDDEEAGHYGITFFASRLGLIGFILYMFSFYKGLKFICEKYNFNKRFALYVLIPLLIVFFSQTVNDRPIVLMIFLLPFVYKVNRSINTESFKYN